ncbi:PadR family transcriptional regulator [Streptomyces sasae]|uniref:PadR family transcriptional regulator n=1 Tax=Streptomyces sasae TaxID=1266772 RepID=UPI00292D5690|nr:PadR family transcriptional regulator [Streptomyces sasae]
MAQELAGHGYQISPGALYSTLHRSDGLLVSEQRVAGGRTRRVYRATEAGKAALDEDRRARAELAGPRGPARRRPAPPVAGQSVFRCGGRVPSRLSLERAVASRERSNGPRRSGTGGRPGLRTHGEAPGHPSARSL